MGRSKAEHPVHIPREDPVAKKLDGLRAAQAEFLVRVAGYLTTFERNLRARALDDDEDDAEEISDQVDYMCEFLDEMLEALDSGTENGFGDDEAEEGTDESDEPDE
jgi:hypothetical protein